MWAVLLIGILALGLFALGKLDSFRRSQGVLWSEIIALLLAPGKALSRGAGLYARTLLLGTLAASIFSILATFCWLACLRLGWHTAGYTSLFLASLAWLLLLLAAWPALFAVRTLAALAPPLAELARQEARRAARAFVYVFTPLPLLSLVPASAGLLQLGGILFLIIMLAVGAYGGLFQLPSFLGTGALKAILIGLLATQTLILFLPAAPLSTRSWVRKKISQIIPSAKLIALDQISAIQDWNHPLDGTPNYHYSSENGHYHLYDAPGYCAITGVELQPVDSAAKTAILNWAQQKAAVQEQTRLESLTQQQHTQREEATARLTSLPTQSNRPQHSEIAVLIAPDTSPAFSDSLEQAFDQSSLQDRTWQPRALNHQSFDHDKFEQLWSGDLSLLQQTHLHQRFDAICLVRLISDARPGDSIAGLHTAHATVTLRFLTLAPPLAHATRSFSFQSPASSAPASLSALAKQLSEQLPPKLHTLAIP